METERTDTFERFSVKIGEKLEVYVTRKRDEHHDHGYIHDINVLERVDMGTGFRYTVWELHDELSEDFIRALIAAHGKRKKWVEEGTNWNLGEEGA